ncbi:MAG TPA: Lrp/AsnC family transcriptional regulator [Thermoanaerobaculia bacterium]|nr:Lrp/AsnC family transcriptional regulator [Thermoanaerobaculia bacterium]
MTVALDEHDLAILAALCADARTPVSQIAELIGLSRPAVAERIDKLERNGVLRGTTAVIDPVKVGKSVTAFVSAREKGAINAGHRSALRALLAREEVLEMHSVAGDDCYLIKIRTDSIQSLNQLVSTLGTPPLNVSTRTTIVMHTYGEKVGGILIAPEEIAR